MDSFKMPLTSHPCIGLRHHLYTVYRQSIDNPSTTILHDGWYRTLPSTSKWEISITNWVQTSRPVQIGIIGAGIGGLAAAIAMSQAGAQVTVLEAAEELGEVCPNL